MSETKTIEELNESCRKFDCYVRELGEKLEGVKWKEPDSFDAVVGLLTGMDANSSEECVSNIPRLVRELLEFDARDGFLDILRCVKETEDIAVIFHGRISYEFESSREFDTDYLMTALISYAAHASMRMYVEMGVVRHYKSGCGHDAFMYIGDEDKGELTS